MHKQKFRLRNNLILNILFSFSSVTLALFGFLAVLPPATEPEASAIIDGEQFALTVTNSDSLSLEIDPTDSGTIAIAKDTIVANTNSPAGYKLYVSTDSTTSNNIHLNGRESNNTEDKKLVATTGTNELPTTLENNSWGFAIAGAGNFDTTYNTENPSMSAKFAAVPQKDAEQLIHDHSGRATDDETEIYFAAKANTNIASGNYSTTILYTTLSEATDQDTTEINLENAAFPTNYEAATVAMNTSIISSKTPTITVKVGTKDATNVVITNNAPLSLTFDLPANLTEGTYDITLSVTNLAKSYTKQNAIGIYKPMQEMTPELCESMILEEQKQFLDTRDNKVYFAAKLKDGNCWMTQNLDYDLSVSSNQTLTPATSNVTENRTVVPVKDLATWGEDENSIYYLDGGDTYYANGTTKTEGYSTLPANDINRHYAGGDYYSWTAATAGQGTIDIIDTDVNESICPAGWRLPTSNSATVNYSFGNLVKQYGYTEENQYDTSDATLLNSPLFFVRGGGIIDSGSLSYQGDGGAYWSSRALSDSYIAYDLVFSSSYVVYDDCESGRFEGFSVRCVAQSKNTFTLTYNANTGSGAPETQTETTTNPTYTFTIPSATPQKEGYNFLGWSESQNATTATYQPGAEITLDIHAQNKTLYAIYEKIYPLMQDVSSWKNTLTLEQQIQVKDARDGKIYWVSKLKDGNIWMTQNLDYDLSVQANQILTPATSNVTENRTVVPVNTDLATFASDNNATYYLDGGDTYYANGTTKTEGYSSLPEDSTNRHYAQGDYYSWKAATAGVGTTSITNTDVNESICPAGWRLPTSNSATANYSFGSLVKQYGYTGSDQSGTTDATLLASPLFFARGGDVYSGSLRDQGSYGSYCSSRANSNGNLTYSLYFNSSSFVIPSGEYGRGYGLSVRCVAL